MAYREQGVDGQDGPLDPWIEEGWSRLKIIRESRKIGIMTREEEAREANRRLRKIRPAPVAKPRVQSCVRARRVRSVSTTATTSDGGDPDPEPEPPRRPIRAASWRAFFQDDSTPQNQDFDDGSRRARPAPTGDHWEHTGGREINWWEERDRLSTKPLPTTPPRLFSKDPEADLPQKPVNVPAWWGPFGEGVGTLEACAVRAKKMGRLDMRWAARAREFCEIRKAYPENGVDLRVLNDLCNPSLSNQQISDRVGRTARAVRIIAARIKEQVAAGQVKRVQQSEVIDLFSPLPKTAWGRKKGGATQPKGGWGEVRGSAVAVAACADGGAI
ncbi:MAG: hypothetical protein M0Z85_04325 [Gammaproteobacteria bacterium]|nr:hypothetical protein [Gammaproteobacteria bacterium]